MDKKKNNLESNLRIKFALYFTLSSLVLLIFWYYVSLFGVIYRHTQLHLLIDTFISFGLSLVYPFVILLLPGIFRIPSLRISKKGSKCLYSLSKLLQLV